MNARTLFNNLLENKEIKRFPIDYLAHRETDLNLKKYLGLNSEKELLDYLGCDFYYLPGRDISQNEGFMKFYCGNKLFYSEKERTCPLGIHWLRGAYDSKFSVDEAICGPLENAQSAKDILSHDWPKVSDFDFTKLIEECESNQARVIIGGLWTGIMGDSYRLHGFENFLTNMALKPQLIKTLIDKLTEVYLKLNDIYFSQVKGKMDIWFFGNDFGSQQGLLLSPNMWYDFFFENLKKLTGLAHSYNLKVMMHSCGAISEIIPYLIEAGIDIIDPVQVTAKGMQPEILAKNFKDNIIFHGGIDTQQILPNGTQNEVKEHVKKIKDTLGFYNKYIFAPSQLLGPDIPIENILAMYEAAQ